MISNIVLGSVFYVAITREISQIEKWLSIALALAGALAGGLQTYFDFGRAFDGHRRIANRYAEIIKRCDFALARHNDGLSDLSALSAELSSLQQMFTQISKDAETLPTSHRDYDRARKSEHTRRQHSENPIVRAAPAGELVGPLPAREPNRQHWTKLESSHSSRI